MATVREQWGMACPKCNCDDQLVVQVKTWATLSADGTEVEGDQEWNEDSCCSCDACGWTGVVFDARIKEQS